MNGIDVMLGALLVTALLLGLVSGLVRIAFAVVSLAVGGVAAVAFAAGAGRWLGRFVASPELALLLGFVGIYALVLVVFSLGGLVLRRLVARIGLGWADRLFGALLAGALVLAASSLVSFALVRVLPRAPLVTGSWALPRLAGVTATGADALPPRVQAELGRVFGLFEARVVERASRGRREVPLERETRGGSGAVTSGTPRSRPTPAGSAAGASSSRSHAPALAREE